MEYNRAKQIICNLIKHCEDNDLQLIDKYNNIIDLGNFYLEGDEISYKVNRITYRLFINDPEFDEGLYTPEDKWVKETLNNLSVISKPKRISEIIHLIK